MKDIFLVNYSVKGIKTLDELVSVSFYKKTISNELNTQEYNMKGIYGMNGSGKTGIITSVDILKNLLSNPGYLNNTMVQKHLDAMINKRQGRLVIEADFIIQLRDEVDFYRYSITLGKDELGKYVIAKESLKTKRATSKSENLEPIFEVVNGEIAFIKGNSNDEIQKLLLKKTINLLSTTSLCALFFEKILIYLLRKNNKTFNEPFTSLLILYILGRSLHVYLDQADDHSDYLLQNSYEYMNGLDVDSLMDNLFEMSKEYLPVVKITRNIIAKNSYKEFEKTIKNLYEFLHIFKADLKGIEIDKKEDENLYICNLIMVYDTYRIDAEYESTGIKKLIKLFVYLREMVRGGIVFIDEFDSNLHDVYLCALIEYLMEYGQGQLCFTTHNVGPMDVLKRHKKSIDFLSVDHKIYPWRTNGNYSPSKLYRNGMIEGSPFNIDSTDFIGVFGVEEEVD